MRPIVPPRGSVKMQYFDYDYIAAEHHGNRQTGFVQQSGPQVVWTLSGYCGVRGFFNVAGFCGGHAVSAASLYDWLEHDYDVDQQVKELAADISSMGGSAAELYQKDYRYLPYTLRNGEVQVLSRWNMERQKLTVSRVQCKVRVAADGSHATLTSCGKGPTLVRAWGGLWNALYKGEQHLLADGDQVSLNWHDPDAAIFTCQVQSLPSGWTMAVDSTSGACYYYNEQTGESQWEPPHALHGHPM